VDRHRAQAAPAEDLLDMDSSESPTCGEQEGSAYSGHSGCTCYHPLFAFNQLGDLERCALWPGNVHSADGWRGVLEPVVWRCRGKGTRVHFRGDVVCAHPDIYEFLEVEGMGYTIRLPANRVLQDKIGYLLKRSVGRLPHEVRRNYASFRYRARWKKPRRVVAKIEWHPGELYPWVGFIVTNLARPAERVVAFYNERGTAEQWIKESKGAIKWTRLPCHSFAANVVRLQIYALA
jgi:Transposase DDE domain group 1